MDDSPGELTVSARRDPDIRALCLEVAYVAWDIEHNERCKQEQLACASEIFISMWREYEARWQILLAVVEADEPRLDVVSGAPNDCGLKAKWTHADGEAEGQSQVVQEVIQFGQYNIGQEHRRPDFGEEYVEQVQEGLAAWHRLEHDNGLDLRAIFRRRQLIPFVYVPDRVDLSERSSQVSLMLANLREAHQAFVYGALCASLALMRSVLEAVLRELYGAADGNLVDQINKARRLPHEADRGVLHDLRTLANGVLHLEPEKSKVWNSLSDEGRELRIVRHLLHLRTLIEFSRR